MRDGVILDRVGNISTTGNLSERVNLRQQTEPLLNSDGLYMVTRTLEIVYPVGQDTGNYTCTATVEVLNQTLSDSITFDVVVQSKRIMISVIAVQLLYLLCTFLSIHSCTSYYCDSSGCSDCISRYSNVLL